MTKKDFELIAKTIYDFRSGDEHLHDGERRPVQETVDNLVRCLGFALKRTNVRFDFFKFIKACGNPR